MPWGDCTGPWWAQGNGPRRRGIGAWFRGFFGRGPWWMGSTDEPTYSREDEKAYLKAEESWLKSRLEAIRSRLRDLGEE